MTRTYHRRADARKVVFACLLAATAAAYGFLRWRPFRVEVEGPSMRPMLEPGDWAIAVVPGRLRRGDVVVVEHPDRPRFDLVKRVIGLPGDMAPDGFRLVDAVWVEGDDPESTDSREFGPVEVPLVRGRLLVVWWPPGRIRWL